MLYLTRETIDFLKLMEKVRHPSAGAVVTFLGTVRDLTGSEVTTALEYEAFGPMAEKVLGNILQETRGKWDLSGLEILHRLGFLAVGEISIAVAVSSPHRLTAFQACQFVIDRVKQEVPIWKKDYTPTCESNWIHPTPDLSSCAKKGNSSIEFPHN